jgi:hypothetical protein
MNGKAGNPHTGTDSKTAFNLVDPATKQRYLVREMSHAQLASFRAGVAEVSHAKMKATITRLSLIVPNPLDASLIITLFEQAVINAALLLVLEYEQNRRANLTELVVP